jgi:hypothetical protein
MNKNILDKEIFKKESADILNLIKKGDLGLAKKSFEVYKDKYEKIINNPSSEFYCCVPFYKSVEEFLFDDFAKEKGITSINEIEENFKEDVLNIK